MVREAPDAFLVGIYDEAPALVIGSLANARRNLTKSGASVQEFLDLLKEQGLMKLVERLHSHIAELWSSNPIAGPCSRFVRRKSHKIAMRDNAVGGRLLSITS